MRDIIKQDKADLRYQLKNIRNSIPATEREILSAQINKRLIKICATKSIKTVHTFIPMSFEINIKPCIEYLLRNNITVVAPQTHKNRKLSHLILESLSKLNDGLFNTQHPSSNRTYEGTYDLILVPGLAFNAKLQRLGYGGGYYDSFLSQHPNAYKIGVCFPIQIISTIPTELHDQRVDEIQY